jgi:hypothetical protein
MMRFEFFTLDQKSIQQSTQAPLSSGRGVGKGGERSELLPRHPLPTLSLRGRGLVSSDLLSFVFGFVGCVLRTTPQLATTNNANCERRDGALSALYMLTTRFL